ncbi:MAG TPA: hypothetical protein VJ323_17305, partial [Bryobacteraceae bacterium]|nr:hypothetical protein [Bryobacteraceae bacterium]
MVFRFSSLPGSINLIGAIETSGWDRDKTIRKAWPSPQPFFEDVRSSIKRKMPVVTLDGKGEFGFELGGVSALFL